MPQCNRPVVRGEEREILVRVEEKGLLRRVEETLVSKISRLERELRETKDSRRIHLLSSSLFMLLSSLDIVKKLKDRK